MRQFTAKICVSFKTYGIYSECSIRVYCNLRDVPRFQCTINLEVFDNKFLRLAESTKI